MSILIIIFSLLILGAIVYFLFFYNFKQDVEILRGEEKIAEESESPSLEPEKGQITKKVPKKEENKTEPPDEEDIISANLQKIASSFAERFGSYSNHSDYENITDLKVFMSVKMAVWADRFIKESREKSDYAAIYEGVVTKAVSSEIKNINLGEGEAEISVKTQKIKLSGAISNFSTEYEDISISFVKEGGVWKVDSAYWQ